MTRRTRANAEPELAGVDPGSGADIVAGGVRAARAEAGEMGGRGNAATCTAVKIIIAPIGVTVDMCKCTGYVF